MSDWQPWVWHELFAADLKAVTGQLASVVGSLAEQTLYPELLVQAESLSSGRRLIEQRPRGLIRLITVLTVGRAAVFLFFEVNADGALHGLHLVGVLAEGSRSAGRPTDSDWAEAQRRSDNPDEASGDWERGGEAS